MSNRPAPRKSSLSGSSPVHPPAVAPAAAEASAVAREAAEPPTSAQTRPATGGRTAKAKGWARKITVYQQEEDSARMRGAMVATIPYEGLTTLSAFVQSAIDEKVARLEEKYNNGEPFPPVGTGVIPTGRPMGE